MSILLITHDLGVVTEIAERIMVMYAGEGVEIGSTRDLLDNPHHPYTKGLISSRPKQGITVNPETNWNLYDSDVLEWILKSKPSLHLLKEFTQVRFAIEPMAAKLAAENATPAQINQMETALYRISEAQEGLEDQLDAHINFLNMILVASGNRFFIQLTQFVDAALRVSIRYTNQVKGISNTDVTFHVKVFNAIKNGDASTAQKLIYDVLSEALTLIESRL